MKNDTTTAAPRLLTPAEVRALVAEQVRIADELHERFLRSMARLDAAGL
jgi:hypothetical protein